MGGVKKLAGSKQIIIIIIFNVSFAAKADVGDAHNTQLPTPASHPLAG